MAIKALAQKKRMSWVQKRNENRKKHRPFQRVKGGKGCKKKKNREIFLEESGAENLQAPKVASAPDSDKVLWGKVRAGGERIETGKKKDPREGFKKADCKASVLACELS